MSITNKNYVAIIDYLKTIIENNGFTLYSMETIYDSISLRINDKIIGRIDTSNFSLTLFNFKLNEYCKLEQDEDLYPNLYNLYMCISNGILKDVFKKDLDRIITKICDIMQIEKNITLHIKELFDNEPNLNTFRAKKQIYLKLERLKHSRYI